jgi:A/G-specific adenine glycosylase
MPQYPTARTAAGLKRGIRRPAWIGPLLRWFRAQRRDLPWRRRRPDPYRVWISEIMLQQTQVQTVVPYFRRFIRRFPTVASVAEADLQELLKVWEGLGYYSRARRLQAAARIVMAEYGGRLPHEVEALRRLPGIGPYTAAAVASISFGVPEPVVDGNVRRVFARFWGLARDSRSPAFHRLLTARLRAVVAGAPPAEFNQALMELGALVCAPRAPRCAACPLRNACAALATGRTGVLPLRRAARPTPHYRIAVGVIWKRGRILIARRPERQMLGGLWEFPGGKCRRGETPAQAARREIREETGLRVRLGPPYAVVEHAYSHFRITLTAFRCEWAAGRARPRSAAALKWIAPADLDRYPFPRANRKIAAAIQKEALKAMAQK